MDEFRRRFDGLVALRDDPRRRWGYLSLLWLTGAVALTLVTILCFQLKFEPAAAALTYLVVIVLLSMFDSFVSSAIFSVIAVACIDYYFLPPLFQFEIRNSRDAVTLASFVITSLVITSLVRKVRDLGQLNRQKSELLELTQKLQKSQDELAYVTRVTSLGELTASIAHEVNQPLSAIVTSGEASLRFLTRDPPDLEEVRSALQRMISDGKRASDVVKRIRTLVRKSEAKTAPLDLNEVVSESVSLLQREVIKHRVVLRLELEPALPAVLGDTVQLQQVIINLILNAIQAMDTVYDRPRQLLIRSSLDGSGQAHVLVQDSGIGLDPETERRLFNAFFSTKAEGMGIGLSICRSIIEAHRGRVWATGNPGPGATFQFSVPAIGQTASPSPTPPNLSRPNLSPSGAD